MPDTDFTQYPVPVGTPGQPTPLPPVVVAPPVNGGIVPPGTGSPGPGQPGFPGDDDPRNRPRPGGWGGNRPDRPGGFERGSWFARFLQRHPQFLTKHPDFLTNHPRIATNYAAYQAANPTGPAPAPAPGVPTAPAPAPAPTAPSVPLTSPQANVVGAPAQAPGSIPTGVRPAMGSPDPRPMAGPTGTGTTAPTLPGMTSGANAILQARSQTARKPNKLGVK